MSLVKDTLLGKTGTEPVLFNLLVSVNSTVIVSIKLTESVAACTCEQTFNLKVGIFVI